MFLALVLTGSMTVTAQLERKSGNQKSTTKAFTTVNNNAAVSRVQPSNQQSSVVIWSDDFSTPANWSATAEAGTVGNWVIGTTPPSGPYAIAPIASATASNGYALFDSDLICSGNQIGNLTNVTPINCSGYSGIRLSFSERYRRWYDSTFVFVSNDGTNFTKYVINSTLAPDGYSGSVNPDVVNLDISSVAGNQATVYVRFQFYSPTSLGANAGCGYAWMIDDVSISDIPATDAAMVSPAFGGEYALLPINQAQAFALNGRIFNNGGTVISGATVDYSVFLDNLTNLMYTGSSAPSGSINPNDTSAVLSAMTPYVPTDTGLYIIRQVVAVSGDVDGLNDTTFAFVYVNDSIYARDYTQFDASGYLGGFGFNTGTGSLCQSYQVFRASAFTSATFFLDDATLGNNVSVTIHPDSSGRPSVLQTLGTTGVYQITANDTGGAFITLPFTSPVSVTAGNYFISVNQLSPANITLGAISDIYTPGRVFFRTTGAWNPIEPTFRFSFILDVNNPSSTLVGVKQIERNNSLTIYPNPSQGIVHILNQNGTDKDVTVTVLNAVGQVVFTRDYTSFSNEKVDLRNQPEGMYTIQVRTAQGVSTKNVVISNK